MKLIYILNFLNLIHSDIMSYKNVIPFQLNEKELNLIYERLTEINKQATTNYNIIKKGKIIYKLWLIIEDLKKHLNNLLLLPIELKSFSNHVYFEILINNYIKNIELKDFDLFKKSLNELENKMNQIVNDNQFSSEEIKNQFKLIIKEKNENDVILQNSYLYQLYYKKELNYYLSNDHFFNNLKFLLTSNDLKKIGSLNFINRAIWSKISKIYKKLLNKRIELKNLDYNFIIDIHYFLSKSALLNLVKIQYEIKTYILYKDPIQNIKIKILQAIDVFSKELNVYENLRSLKKSIINAGLNTSGFYRHSSFIPFNKDKNIYDINLLVEKIEERLNRLMNNQPTLLNHSEILRLLKRPVYRSHQNKADPKLTTTVINKSDHFINNLDSVIQKTQLPSFHNTFGPNSKPNDITILRVPGFDLSQSFNIQHIECQKSIFNKRKHQSNSSTLNNIKLSKIDNIKSLELKDNIQPQSISVAQNLYLPTVLPGNQDSSSSQTFNNITILDPSTNSTNPDYDSDFDQYLYPVHNTPSYMPQFSKSSIDQHLNSDLNIQPVQDDDGSKSNYSQDPIPSHPNDHLPYRTIPVSSVQASSNLQISHTPHVHSLSPSSINHQHNHGESSRLTESDLYIQNLNTGNTYNFKSSPL